jgi:hypothetical protein
MPSIFIWVLLESLGCRFFFHRRKKTLLVVICKLEEKKGSATMIRK